MIRVLRSLAMLMLLVIGVAATPAFAQQQDQKDGPTPVCSARQPVADGRMLVMVTALDDYGKPLSEDLCKNYGYRIGDTITLDVVFVYQPGPGVGVNLDNLMRGKFDPKNGSDFELAGPPERTQPMPQDDGSVVVLVRLKVRSWVYKTHPDNFLAFNSVFLYSAKGLDDGTPDWKPAMTPDYIVTTSQTAAAISKDLNESDTGLQVPPRVTYTENMRYGAYGLVGLVIFYLGFLLARRLMPNRKIAANEVAWNVFDGVLSRSEAGMSYGDAQKVAAYLRFFLGVQSVTDEKEMHETLLAFFEKDEARYELTRTAEEAFAQLDAVLYQPALADMPYPMPKSQVRDLFDRIERLVPRP